MGKVSVRFVPDQEPGALVELLTAHINHEFAKLRSPNTCSVAVRCWGERGALVTLPRLLGLTTEVDGGWRP